MWRSCSPWSRQRLAGMVLATPRRRGKELRKSEHQRLAMSWRKENDSAQARLDRLFHPTISEASQTEMPVPHSMSMRTRLVPKLPSWEPPKGLQAMGGLSLASYRRRRNAPGRRSNRYARDWKRHMLPIQREKSLLPSTTLMIREPSRPVWKNSSLFIIHSLIYYSVDRSCESSSSFCALNT